MKMDNKMMVGWQQCFILWHKLYVVIIKQVTGVIVTVERMYNMYKIGIFSSHFSIGMSLEGSDRVGRILTLCILCIPDDGVCRH
jgi:hypothetical protein